MNKYQSVLRVSFFFMISLAVNSLAQGQANRTWVSGVGDDVNPCSRTAPCKTFAGAISKTAAGGEINALDPGGFGAVTITKSITIDGSATLAGILAGQTTGIIVNITSDTDIEKSVRLRGIAINGVGSGLNGIRVASAKRVSIEDVIIDGFKNNGIQVDCPTPVQVLVMNTTIRNNAGSAVNVVQTGNQVALSDVSLVYNEVALTAGKGSILPLKGNLSYGNKKDGDVTIPR